MSIFDDMNVETQLQVAYSLIAQLKDQIDGLNKANWSLEERLRISDEGKEDLKKFYENQMDILRVEHQKSIDVAVSRITKSFEEQIAKLIEERDAALLSAKSWRGKNFGRKSERNAGEGKDDDNNGPGAEKRESEKADYVDAETQKEKDNKKRSGEEKSTIEAESYEEHLYEAAHVRSNDKDEYKTTDILEAGRPVPGCMFSVEMLAHILCEKYQYHTPIDQIVEKLHHQGLKIPKSVIGEHLHRAIEWLSDKLEAFWEAEVRRSWILMLDETRVLVGCTDPETNERTYKDKYMWGIRANSMNLSYFI